MPAGAARWPIARVLTEQRIAEQRRSDDLIAEMTVLNMAVSAAFNGKKAHKVFSDALKKMAE